MRRTFKQPFKKTSSFSFSLFDDIWLENVLCGGGVVVTVLIILSKISMQKFKDEVLEGKAKRRRQELAR